MIPKRRKLFFVALLAVLLALAMELTAWLGLRLVTGEWSSHSQLAEARAAVRDAEATGGGRTSAVGRSRELGRYFRHVALHPFLGYVMDADRWRGELADPLAEELGLPDGLGVVFEPPRPDRVVIGVFGGSVANLLATETPGELRSRLARSPRFAGKQIVVVSAALGGYKQPQQLMTFSYLLFLGAHFDVVVNVDGFNEVALPQPELMPHGVFPLYPRNWPYRVANFNLGLRRALGRFPP